MVKKIIVYHLLGSSVLLALLQTEFAREFVKHSGRQLAGQPVREVG